MNSDKKDENKTDDTNSVISENKSSSQTISRKPEKNVKWSPENEMIMVEWCDVAQCYKWLNTRAHAKFSKAHAWFTIPAITLSTITGTASFAMSSLPVAMQAYAPAIIGSINIFIGILSTVQQYLKISELNEAHRVSAISWDKFARNIRIELAKDPTERSDAGQFLKICRMEYDRLMETSPAIQQNIVAEFSGAFRGKPESIERKRFEELRKPDICNTIVSANESRHHWYKDIEHLDKSTDGYDVSDCLHEDDHIELLRINHDKEIEERVAKQKVTLEAYKLKLDIEKITKYVTAFEETIGRKPHIDEIISNIGDSIGDNAIEQFKDIL